MALSKDDQDTFDRLLRLIETTRTETRLYNDYYEGLHQLEQLGLAIPEELKRFTVVVNWPRVTVDAIEQRLDVTGFRMPGAQSADAALWDVYQYNNLDERSGFAHVDALALKRSYVCVGSNAEDPEYPIVTVESPEEMVAVRDPRTHRVTAALRSYSPEGGKDTRATLYFPNVTYWLLYKDGEWVDEFDPDVHNLGTVPVVPFVNRNRATRVTGSSLEGVSEMEDVIPIADSASRALTNAQLAQETVAVPQKQVLGMSKGDFVGQDGQPLPVWQAYFGSVWAHENKDVKVQQLDASDLSNFDTMVAMYSRLASGVTSLPIEYFGLNTQNAPSAEGQRAGETRLIKKAERKQLSFGNSWEAVMRLVIRFRTGEWSQDARRMETLWRDAGTPTQGMVTDAVVKEYQAGLTDWETAQENLGRSPETIARMKTRRAEDENFAAQQASRVVTNTQDIFDNQ
ncbi:phage portal protein [Curtobacterium sp. MCLR17_032]|uniref:phage portal protein n=1 Tax=Curtobacterium sp. MCLR17_032 TaxID=2175650 RepID=UPI0015E895E8|nr:phage portal protein [Curtobacterium sp. MCLR17_032]WIE60739.1 phage portal protein [Curtobacterium sp. MCLR17_032]